MEPAIKPLTDIQPFLDRVVLWAMAYANIQVVALVGSYAREKATQTSDIDLVLLVDEPKNYLDEHLNHVCPPRSERR